MDTVTAFAKPVTEVGTSAAPATSQTAQTLTVTATYQLSEEGRKASLLAGGDGRAVQQIQPTSCECGSARRRPAEAAAAVPA
jgi:hypothetical protein